MTELEKIEEFRQTLKQVFDKGIEGTHIHFDGQSCRNSYLRESWNYYIENGYIIVKNVETEQESFLKGYITPKGKEWIK